MKIGTTLFRIIILIRNNPFYIQTLVFYVWFNFMVSFYCSFYDSDVLLLVNMMILKRSQFSLYIDLLSTNSSSFFNYLKNQQFFVIVLFASLLQSFTHSIYHMIIQLISLDCTKSLLFRFPQKNLFLTRRFPHSHKTVVLSCFILHKRSALFTVSLFNASEHII